MYRLQTTVNGRTWREMPFRNRFPTESAAWEYARSLDPDGLLMPDVRVVDDTGRPCPRPGR